MENREGYYVSKEVRECTKCGNLFPNKSKTVTLCGTCNSKRVTEQSPEVKMYRRAKSRAREKDIEFSLDKEDISIPTHCPILEIELSTYKGHSGGRKNSPALDRIDNSKGYVKGNVQVISHLANMMKSSATNEELILFAEWINTHLRTNDS